MSKTTKTSGKVSFVFFGSGPVAAKSLALLTESFDIEAVVTKPTTLHEMQSISSDVPVHAVATKAELDDLIAAKPFKSHLGVLIDFGIIVSQGVIDYFRLGIVNSHFSLLPELRGADPITFAILSGQQETGVSLMLLVEAMDEGPLLAQDTYTITEDETTETLTEALIYRSYLLLKDKLPLYTTGKLSPYPQRTETLTPTYSRKLTKEDGILDFNKPAADLEREVRAFAGWPKSRTTLAGKDVVITKTHTLEKQGEPGKVVVENKSILIYCGQGTLVIERLKPAGKKEMTVEAFLAGHKNTLS